MGANGERHGSLAERPILREGKRRRKGRMGQMVVFLGKRGVPRYSF